jgi:hypothetical protein
MTTPNAETDQANRKWAVLIGINEYPKLPPRNQLNGCVNDVDAIEQLLSGELFGFPQANILKLTNQDATREGILEAFKTHLIENDSVRSDDVVVVYYSGHGSYVKDMHGDEEDGYDETIVPYDAGRGSSQDVCDITDDEIELLIDALTERTRNVNLWFDSCHSGTITRNLQDAQEADAEGVARWVEPWEDDVPLQTMVPVRTATRGMGPSGWLPLSDGYVLVSGCKAHERSHEYPFPKGLLPIPRKWHGAFTYYLLEALEDVNSETTYYDIWDRIRGSVTTKNRGQNPQIEGAFERKVFGGAALPRRRYVEVVEITGESVTLAAGLVQGATAGSRFAIYPENTETFEDAASRVATVKLTMVEAFASRGEFEHGDIRRVHVGAPAVEIEHDYGRMQMTVHVTGDDPILDNVRREIESSRLLVLAAAEEDQVSTATVRLRHPLSLDGSEDTSADKNLFVLGSGDGHPLIEPIKPSTDSSVVVREKLEHIARYNNVLAIRNVDKQSQLKGKIKLDLHKVTGKEANGQDKTEQVKRNAGGDIVLKAGDRVVLEVTNLSDQPLHVIVLDCDTEWQVLPIFPKSGASDDVVLANRSRRTNRFRVNLPEHQKLVHDNQPLPFETVKVIATTERVDFRSIWLPAMRGEGERDLSQIEGARSSLYNLLELATGGGEERATRSLEEDTDPVVRDWTTDEVVFHIMA